MNQGWSVKARPKQLLACRCPVDRAVQSARRIFPGASATAAATAAQASSVVAVTGLLEAAGVPLFCPTLLTWRLVATWHITTSAACHSAVKESAHWRSWQVSFYAHTSDTIS